MSTRSASQVDASTTGLLCDVKTVSEILGCSTRHVYRLSDSGRMPAPLRLGSLVRWNRARVQEWIDAGCPSHRRARR